MCSYKQVYLGPYIRVKRPIIKKDESYKVNSNGDKYNLDVNFDSDTGEKLKLVEIIKEEKGWIEHLTVSEDEETMAMEYSDLEYFTNYDIPGDDKSDYQTLLVNKRDYYFEDPEVFDLTESEIDYSEEIMNMKLQGRKPLEFYKNKYGGITYHYGLVIFYN
jgi:hypothetical protein